ncbi:divinyl chlorophyllide a 8-vinyl-reductase [Gracilaria domingensis]|nr:divinyl chlorophyllide a 8-vinyl-reductase [Gracilaria domingensis]
MVQYARERAQADLMLVQSLMSNVKTGMLSAVAIGAIATSCLLPAWADIPSFKPDALLVDDAGLIQKGSEELFTKAMTNIRDKQGYTVRFAMVKSIPYGETPDEFASELAEQWQLEGNDVLFVASPKLARAGVFVGDKASSRLTKEIAESVANDTFAVAAGEERYGSAVLDVSNRLIPVLSGEEDPGPPEVKIREVVQTYKTKAETKNDRTKYIAVVVVVLVISFVAPLLQTYCLPRHVARCVELRASPQISHSRPQTVQPSPSLRGESTRTPLSSVLDRDAADMAFISPLPCYTGSTTRGRAVCLTRRATFTTHAPRASHVIRRALRMDAAGEGIYAPTTKPSDVRVVIFGATGYIGRYVVFEFVRQGYQVVAFSRERSGVKGKNSAQDVRNDFKGATVVFGDVTNAGDVARAFEFGDEQGTSTKPLSTVMVSCLASRTGGIADSNKIDYEATLNTLQQGRKAGASHFILLSAICVQKPLLEFQRAKLKFEAELQQLAQQDDAFSYSIVRPTAFFKSLAGQVERLKKGAAYVMFEDGDLCKCNAISEADLARFMVECAGDSAKRNEILPVGGPGEAVTPKQQAELLFRLIGRKPKYQRLPIGLMNGAIGFFDFLAKVLPFMNDVAEYGRIGKYYAVEDMVGPSFGSDTLEEFFEKAVGEGGMVGQELGDASFL